LLARLLSATVDRHITAAEWTHPAIASPHLSSELRAELNFRSKRMTREAQLPRAYWWPRPITAEEYVAFTPEKLELVGGYLIDDAESKQARLELLALLLTNCGLEDAVTLADKDHWREAMDRSLGGL
jgi:hypothetical protein